MTIDSRFNGKTKWIITAAAAVPLLGLLGSLIGLGIQVGELKGSLEQNRQEIASLHDEVQHLSDRVDQLILVNRNVK